jgi:hypothetical protein
MTSGAIIPTTPPHYSLNRVRVVDLPGVSMDEGVAGKTAFELAPAKALVRAALAQADALGLPDHLRADGITTRWELPRFIDRLLQEATGAQRRAAEDLVARIGRNLGHVLLTLHRGDPVNRDARPDWGDAEWERWAAVRRVWLAGGLSSGLIGSEIARHASEWLDVAGYPHTPDVRTSPFGGDTALLGAARYLPRDAGLCLCCDFGQTAVKRSLFFVAGRALTHRVALPRALAARRWDAVDDPEREGRIYLEFVVDTVCDALAQARDAALPAADVSDVMLSVASYTDGGKLLGPGAYATMSRLTPDIRPVLAEAISGRTGRPCRVHLIHDGTAAAAVFAGESKSATIALGSALGVGFPPAGADQLLTIDDIS